MSKKLISLVLGTFLACTAFSLLADSPSSEAEVRAGDSTDSRIEALRAMTPDQRRAELKKLTPDQRRGLWFQLKRAEALEKKAERTAYRGLAANKASRPAAEQGAGKAVEYDQGKPSKLAPGTIQYDDGTGTTTFGGGAIIGNRFNTHTGGVQVTASGTVDTVQAVVAPGPAQTTNSAGFVLLGPQTTMGGAFAIFSSFTAATGTVDTVTFTGIAANYTGSSFFVLFGDFNNSYVPVFDTGSANGQGFHGVVGYTGGMGPNITSTFDFGGTRNALIRTTGNILPVELISFDAE